MGTRSSEATAVVFALCCCQAASLMLSTLMLELLTDKRAGTGARQRFNQQQKEIVLARSSKECRFAHFLLFCLLYDSKYKKTNKLSLFHCSCYGPVCIVGFWNLGFIGCFEEHTATVSDFSLSSFSSVEHSKTAAVKGAEERPRPRRPEGPSVSVLVPQEPLTGSLSIYWQVRAVWWHQRGFPQRAPSTWGTRIHRATHTNTHPWQSVLRNPSFEETGGIFLHWFKPNLWRMILWLRDPPDSCSVSKHTKQDGDETVWVPSPWMQKINRLNRLPALQSMTLLTPLKASCFCSRLSSGDKRWKVWFQAQHGTSLMALDHVLSPAHHSALNVRNCITAASKIKSDKGKLLFLFSVLHSFLLMNNSHSQIIRHNR